VHLPAERQALLRDHPGLRVALSMMVMLLGAQHARGSPPVDSPAAGPTGEKSAAATSGTSTGAPVIGPTRAGVLKEAPTAAEIDAALVKLRADPNLGREKTQRRLRTRASEDPPPRIPAWLADLFRWIASSLDALLWAIGGLALAFVLVWILRVMRARAPAVEDRMGPPLAASESELRSESLPADIGAAARTLLRAGKSREALSLLYRGALARAVLHYGVSIESSATEAEALDAVRTRLDAARSAYVGEIVRARQMLVYAGHRVQPEAIEALCQEFAPRLESTPEIAAAA
jgi:hypothetical protein